MTLELKSLLERDLGPDSQDINRCLLGVLKHLPMLFALVLWKIVLSAYLHLQVYSLAAVLR